MARRRAKPDAASEVAALLERARAMPGGLELAASALRSALRADRPSPAALERARFDYFATHWGRTSPGQARERAAQTGAPVTALGALLEVVYVTRKGFGREAEYAHTFEAPLPTLAFDRDGLLVVAGGSYQVEARGIVG